jgi:hypothetical protein
MAEDAQFFTFSVALEGDDVAGKQPIDRYRVVIDRSSGGTKAAKLIMLTKYQLADAVLCRRGSHRRTPPGHRPLQHHLIIRRPHHSQSHH